MMDLTNTMLPNHRQPRFLGSTSTPAPVVSHQITAPALSPDPWDIPVGHAVQLDGSIFVWNGSLFRNDHLDAVAWADHAQRVKRFVIAGAVLALMTLAVVYGLDWDTMTGDERDVYKLVGRLAVLVLIAKAWRLFGNSPDHQAREIDRLIRSQLGINQG